MTLVNYPFLHLPARPDGERVQAGQAGARPALRERRLCLQPARRDDMEVTTTRVAMSLKVPEGTVPPAGIAAWRALDGAARDALRAAHGTDVLVRVQDSGLHAGCPGLPYTVDNGVAYLPLH